MLSNLVTRAVLGSESAKTLAELAPLIGGLLGGAASKKLNLGSAVMALRGEGEPPDWLIEVGNALSGLLSKEMARPFVPKLAMSLAQSQGIVPARLLALVRDVTSFLGLDVVVDTPEAILPALDALCDRLAPYRAPQIRAACTCVNCGYFQFISS